MYSNLCPYTPRLSGAANNSGYNFRSVEGRNLQSGPTMLSCKSKFGQNGQTMVSCTLGKTSIGSGGPGRTRTYDQGIMSPLL